jgi:hypothetical protein
MILVNLFAVCPPKKPNHPKITTNVQKNTLNPGRNLGLFHGLVSTKGNNAKIRIAPTIAITPTNLSGNARKIA